MRIVSLFLGLSSLCILPIHAFAHHSQAFFSDVFSQLEGELLEVEWRNPHIRFTLRTEDADGEIENVRIETNSIYYLERAGITRDRINVGDNVVIGGYAAKQEGREFLAAEMLLADGDNVMLIRDGVTQLFDDQVQNTLAENRGIFRVWSIPQNNSREMHTPLTENAVAAKALFDPLDNFSTRCEPAGMPRLMWYPHPYEFQQQGTDILLRLEMYDTVRIIHMDQTEAPDNTPYSRLGYSIGHWEGEDLVVETTHLNWRYYDTIGTPQTHAAVVVERFSLSEDQSRLDYHITTTDPATFVEPATISGHWLALGETIEPYECDIY